MANASESAVVITLRQYRELLEARELDAMRRMAASWLEIERRLDADILALALEMERRAKAGTVVTQQIVYKAEQYQVVKAKLQDEIKRWNRGQLIPQIEASQRDFGMLGIEAAKDSIITSFGGALTAPMFPVLNRAAVEAMVGFLGNGSPLNTLLKQDYPDAIEGLINALVNGMARGLGPGATAKAMAEGMGMGLDRAMLIARTEINRAYRQANIEAYRKSNVVGGYMRLVKKATACLSCLMLDGQRFENKDDFSDPPRGKAELPGNLIVSSNPEAFVTLYHQGDIVVIGTASGKFLPVTPNHPVLTDRGWVAAKFVKEGDNVLSHTGEYGAAGVVGPDKNHIPTLVEKIPSAFNMLRLGAVPESAKHLYANREDGEVDVIFSNRLLWSSYDAARQEEIKQYLFGGGNIAGFSLSALRLIAENLIGMFSTASELLGVGNTGASFGLGHFGKSHLSGLRHTAMGNSVFTQNSSYDVARNTEGFSDKLLGFAGSITGDNIGGRQGDLIPAIGGNFSGLNRKSFGFTPEQPISLEVIRQGLTRGVPSGSDNLNAIAADVVFDRVVYVDVRYFSGHVYSLQTKEGWYSSNQIISHNCIAVPVVAGVDPPTWQKGPEWFKGLSPEQQRAKMGAAKFEAWKDGKFKLEDLAQMKHSDVWGDSPRVPSLAELLQ